MAGLENQIATQTPGVSFFSRAIILVTLSRLLQIGEHASLFILDRL